VTRIDVDEDLDGFQVRFRDKRGLDDADPGVSVLLKRPDVAERDGREQDCRDG
jgi:hypothetical protein